MSKKLVIIGGEGNGGVVAAAVEDNRIRFNDLEWEVVGFINDYETQVCGYPVLGKIGDVNRLVATTDYYFLWAIHTISRNLLIAKTFERCNIPDERLATVVHKSAFIAQSVKLDPGVFINTNCYIGPNTHLGKCCMVMANALIGHNNEIGPFCHFAVGAIMTSYVTMGKYSDLTVGSKTLEHINIGNFAVAGAGCLVTHDIPDYEIWVGIPAKFKKKITEQ